MWPFKKSNSSEVEVDFSLDETKEQIESSHQDHTKNMIGEDEDLNPAYEDEDEGVLAVDVFQKDGLIYIQTMISGVKTEDIEVDIDRDIVTIRGFRPRNFEVSSDQFYLQECHWGAFSRSIVLPLEVDPNQAEADFANGILTISIPKAEKRGTVNIRVRK